jgi:hypothetical protein
MRGVLTPTGAFRAWWSVVMVLVTAVLIAGLNVLYTTHVQRESDRQWCDILASLDAPQTPATTPRGREVQRQIHDLREKKGCL